MQAICNNVHHIHIHYSARKLRAPGLLLADGAPTEGRPGPLSFWVIFLMARTVPPSFVEIGPKLRVVAPLKWEWPKTAKNRGEPQKMTPSPETENFLGVVPMGKL